MSFIWIVLRATAVVGGLMAALVTGGIAHADTTPSLPGVADLGAAVANAPQLLQSVGSALGVLPHPAPAAPPPLAGASITVPQGAVPGMPAAPAPSASSPLAGIPGLTAPGASATAPRVPSAVPGAPANTPSAHVDVPQMPFLPMPLPQQITVPSDLGAIAPGGIPAPSGVTAGPVVAAPAPAAAPTGGFLSALP
jgi:hypothetical protein